MPSIIITEDGQERRQVEQRLVGRRRHDVLLEQQLERVRDRLEQALPADVLGTDAALHAAREAALEPDEVRRPEHDDVGEHEADDQRVQDRALGERHARSAGGAQRIATGADRIRRDRRTLVGCALRGPAARVPSPAAPCAPPPTRITTP